VYSDLYFTVERNYSPRLNLIHRSMI
jgi:hypothetical protein